MKLTNPKLADVPAAFKGIPARGRDEQFSGGILIKPHVDTHVQGLALYKGYHLITYSDRLNKTGRLLVADRSGERNLVAEVFLPVVSVNPPFLSHAGGCQVIGDCLVVPLETPARQKKSSAVLFMDVSDPLHPKEFDPSIRITRDEEAAMAAGITNVKVGGQQRMLVAVYDHGVVDIHQSVASDLSRGFKKRFRTCVIEEHHQALHLLSDTRGQVFAVGLNKTFEGKNEAVLYLLEMNARRLIEVATRADFHPEKGARLRWGASLETLSQSRLVLYCTSKKYTHGCHISRFDAEKRSRRRPSKRRVRLRRGK